MKLYEQGKIKIDDPVTAYLPEFQGGKSSITIRNLMTHYSGLRPDLDLDPAWSGYDTGIRKALIDKPAGPPGSSFVYSDINFELLGEIVRRVSGKPLDQFAREQIFEPLGMRETTFNPAASLAGADRADGSRRRHRQAVARRRARSHRALHGRRRRTRGCVLHRRRSGALRASDARHATCSRRPRSRCSPRPRRRPISRSCAVWAGTSTRRTPPIAATFSRAEHPTDIPDSPDRRCGSIRPANRSW